MGLEQSNSNLYKKGNPETAAQQVEAMGAKPFEIMTNQVPESAILQFMQDPVLMKDIAAANWPTDEERAERIATKRGMGAEQIAAISKYHRASEAGKEKGTETIH